MFLMMKLPTFLLLHLSFSPLLLRGDIVLQQSTNTSTKTDFVERKTNESLRHDDNEIIQSCKSVGSDIILHSSVENYCLDDDAKILSTSHDLLAEASYHTGGQESIQVDRFGSDMGETQIIESNNNAAIEQRIIDARRYLQETVFVDEFYVKVRNQCKNKHSLCAFWASIGECEKNPVWMLRNCAPVCLSCDQLHIETRCPVDPNATDAFAKAGDLNNMFERIIADPYFQQYQPVALSRPDYAPGDTAENVTYKIDSFWMLMLENAISAEEADRFIELGAIEGYERSADVGDENEDGTRSRNINSGRTSTNAWCNGKCYEDPVTRTVLSRIANITGIPERNSERFQLLRYEEGQFYQQHHDYSPHQFNRPCGVRILTFYLYLNDVEEGGGTDFPIVNLTVSPKKGRAVLWPSVLNDNPNQKDSRSDHQALPVMKGVKYGANVWIHQRDFISAHEKGCTS